MWGPHQSPFYFCMNWFHKFHHLELWNLISAYFKTFFFLKKKDDGLRKRKWQPILLKMGLVKPKSSKDEIWESRDYLKKKEFEKLFEEWEWEIIYKSKTRMKKVGGGTWPKGSHVEVILQWDWMPELSLDQTMALWGSALHWDPSRIMILILTPRTFHLRRTLPLSSVNTIPQQIDQKRSCTHP